MSAALIVSSVGLAPAAGVPHADSVPGGLQLVKEDLEFILKQIKVAEASPDGKPQLGTGEGQVISYLAGSGLRTVTGIHNNLLPNLDTYGAADEPFPRLLTPSFKAAGPSCIPGTSGTTDYAWTDNRVVCDSGPRTVSNLIVDQTIDNPAAVQAATRQGTEGELIDVDDDPVAERNVGLFIPNTAPDTGLSARFNAWFTLFGQFFDHGLDLVSKGGNGTVIVPLQPDDPLYRDPAGPDGISGNADDVHTNFMVLTRATNVEPGVQEHKNLTTPFVDQNQTYTSHPSHQVFLREYVDVAGVPVATGKLLDAPAAAGGGLGRWIDVKNQARDLLGITLEDTNIFDVPLVRTDLYGEFTPVGAEGHPELMGGGTGHAFLDDIAHHAVPDAFDHDRNPATPGIQKVADLDETMGDDGDPLTYDDETLDAHYITGDGRGNENIGLTAVHHVFHSEHNRVVDQVKTLVDEQIDDPAFVAEWKDATGASGWDGERLFQAARLVTEMEYQHLVFEEFARKISPAIEVLPRNESGYSPIINPAISAEFAHVVYRFGHSMLTEHVRRIDANGTAADMSLFSAFLNPMAFTNDGAWSAAQGAGAIVRGNILEVGNEIDEFITDVLRNRLIGLPLDLATLNMTRARETGVPGLNEARRQFFAEFDDSSIEPYTSWSNFGAALRNPESLVNFVAAYGTHPTVLGATTTEAKRIAADLLVNGGDGAPADRADFMAGTGEFGGAGSTQAVGLEDVDFWVGGLAERPGVFGSMLGSTFNHVFQRQLESLQFGDRFYYLSRLNGTNLLGQLENNSFGALIARNTDATNLPADVFATPDCVIDVSSAGLSGPVPALPVGCEGSLYREASTGYVRYEGDLHVIMIGSPDEDRIRSGLGDDTIHGTAANDRLEGDDGNDNLFGGDGDDYITDSHGDDVIKAGAGSDRINSGPGLDLLFGGPGKDYISHGATGATESFGGLHDDFIRGGDGIDVVTGNYGDDWLEGGGATDLVQGDNADNLQSDPAGGDDVLISGGGNDDYDAEGGMDIMVAGPGTNRNHGMLGFDWVTNARNPVAADDDMSLFGDAPNTLKPFADRFDLIEGLSGWDMDDILLGDNRSAATEAELALAGHELTTAKIAKVAGLDVVLGGTDTFTGGNIILGGLGSDRIEGRGGDDVLDGDAWLNVKIAGPNGQSYTALSQVQAALFDGSISPRDLSIVREVINPVGEPEEGVVDVAVFSGPQSEYTFPDGLSRTSMRVAHTGGLQTNGTDVLRNFELLRFVVAPGVVEEVSLVEIPNQAPTGTVTITGTLTEGETLEVTENVTDPDGTTTATKQLNWQFESAPGTWVTFNEGASSGVLDDLVVNRQIRVEVSFTDDRGTPEAFASAPVGPVANVNDAPQGVPTIAPADLMEGEVVAADVSAITDADNRDATPAITITWQQSAIGGGGAFTNIAGATGATRTLAAAQANRQVRAVATYTDGFGTVEQVFSEPSPVVGDLFIGNGQANTFAGTVSRDRAEGRGGNDTLNGLAGADTLLGEGGSDTLNGGADNDVLEGGGGTDTLVGGVGDDALNGGAAADQLTGGAGNDTITTGAGTDVIRFTAAGFGTDTVADFDANPGGGGQDLLNVNGTGVDAGNFTARVTLVVAGGNTTVTITDGTTVIGTIVLLGVDGVGANSISVADFRFTG